jgi:hypothetical protein
MLQEEETALQPLVAYLTCGIAGEPPPSDERLQSREIGVRLSGLLLLLSGWPVFSVTSPDPSLVIVQLLQWGRNTPVKHA